MSKFDFELLAAGFSAILGAEVVISKHAPPAGAVPGVVAAAVQGDVAGAVPRVVAGAAMGAAVLQTISIHDIFHLTYVPIPLETVNPGELFEIHVKTLTGTKITLQVSESFTIADVKAAVEVKEGIPARNQRLVFGGKPLGEAETVKSAGIPHGGTIFLIVLLRGGAPELHISESEFARSYDYDFTDQSDDGKRYMRGKFEYHRPYGWYRYALQVLGNSKYGEDTWLGAQGIRTDSSTGEWPVSYHGTNMDSARKIIEGGYKPGPRQRFGKGVYSSPSLPMVKQYYAQEFDYNGSTWKIALQNRVNPASDHLKIVPAAETGVGADYWVSTKHDTKEGIYDVRPYGVVVCEV